MHTNSYVLIPFLVLVQCTLGTASGCDVRVISFSLLGNELEGLHTPNQTLGQLEYKDRNLYLAGREGCVTQRYLLNGIIDVNYRNELMRYLLGKNACIDPRICPPEVVSKPRLTEENSLAVFWKWDDHVYERPLDWSNVRSMLANTSKLSHWLIEINVARNFMLSMSLKEAERYAGDDILALPFDGSQFLLSESVVDIADCARRYGGERMSYVMVPMVRLRGSLGNFEKRNAKPLGVSTRAELLANCRGKCRSTCHGMSFCMEFTSEPQMAFWFPKTWNPVIDPPEWFDESLVFGKYNKVAYLYKRCNYNWRLRTLWQKKYYLSAERQCMIKTDNCITAGHSIRLSAMNEKSPKTRRNQDRVRALWELPSVIRQIYATQSQNICSGIGTYPLCGPAE